MSEIFVRKQEIRPGKTDRLREWIADLYEAAEGDREGVRDIWAAESLQTISLFVEHAENADHLVWYLEADSMEQLVAARDASTHPLHEVEDAMLAEVLVDPTETGDFEPLFHGVSPDRSDTFAVEQYSGGSQ